MLTWLPPSPPLSDAEDDIYYDQTGEYLYEQLPMDESRLPATIHELHRPRPLAPPSAAAAAPVPGRYVPEIVVPTTTPYPIMAGVLPPIVAMPPSPTGMCTVASGIVRDVISSPSASLASISHERGINLIPQTGASSGAAYLDTSNLLRPATPSRLPGTVDDAIDSVRKSAQKAVAGLATPRSQLGAGRTSLADIRSGKSELRRPFTPPPRQREAIDYDGTEWSIAEDHEALLLLTDRQQLPDHLHSTKIGQYANWDLVSNLLLANLSTIYRSPRQCSLHYQMVVQPREEGRMVTLDPITKKTRRVPLSSGEMIHMKRGRTKTDQQYFADILKLASNQFDKKTKALRAASLRRTSPFHPALSGGDGEAYRAPQMHELKFAEHGVRYGTGATTCPDIVDYRSERREEMREQNRKCLQRKEEEDQKKEATLLEQQRNHEQKLLRKGSAVNAIPGIIRYQRVTYGSVMEHAQQQLAAVTAPAGIGVTPAVSTVRTYASGNYVQGSLVSTGMSGQSTAYGGETTQVIAGQRAYVDHPQVLPKFQAVSGAAPGAHQISTRRVAIPVGSGAPAQHQIVMTSGSQMGSSGAQQPYAVVVTSQESLSGQQLGGRFQYTTRQEGLGERQTVYRTIPPSGTKRGLPPSAAQRQKMFQIAAGYGTPPEAQQQIYATTSHGGRTLIMSQGDSSQLGEPSQIQMIRPQIQAGGISMRQDVRPKLPQRTPIRKVPISRENTVLQPGRLFLTTASGDRTYLMQQPQVRMMPGGQRITQKRTGTPMHTKTVGGQPQVTMMLPSRGGTVQQIRTIPRNIGYQSSRVPSIGLVMSGSRGSETIGGSGTTKQLPSGSGISRQTISGPSPSTRQVTVAVQGGAVSSASSMLQDHPMSMPSQQHQHQQQTQYLPPITLSSQSQSSSSSSSSVQQRYLTTLPPGGGGGGGNSSSGNDGTTGGTGGASSGGMHASSTDMA